MFIASLLGRTRNRRMDLNKATLDQYIEKLSPHAAELAAYIVLGAEDIAMDWRRYAVTALHARLPSSSQLVKADLLQVMAGANPTLEWIAGTPATEDQREAQLFVNILRLASLLPE